MLFALLSGMDLLPEDIDLALKFTLKDSRIAYLLAERCKVCIRLLHVAPHLFILRLNIAVRLVGVLQILAYNLNLAFQLPGLLPNPFHVHKEHIDVVSLKFFFLPQVDLGFLCLFFQRADLFLQLRKDIVDTQKVLPLAFQLLLCSRLAPLVFDNARRLIEQLPAFLRLPAQYTLNLPLPDDGIAFLTNPCVIKQLIDVFQAAGRTIDKVLALPGTVNPSRYRHFIVIHIQLPVAVVQRNRNKSIAQRLAVLRA